MFSGIVEAKVALLKWTPENQIVLQKPNNFDDLKSGDSLAVNGVCLTLEWQDMSPNSDGVGSAMGFALGAETLKITGWSEDELRRHPLNIERSIRLGDRVHGHFMSGHADAVGTVQTVENLKTSCNIIVKAPMSLRRFVWKKGSLAINGVSLTINEVSDRLSCFEMSFCLIPETLRRTNLGDLQAGDKVILEADTMARAWVRQLDLARAARQKPQSELNA